MTKYVTLVLAAAVSFSAKAYATDATFDTGSGSDTTLEALKAFAGPGGQHHDGIPQPGQPGHVDPGHNGQLPDNHGHDNLPGNHGQPQPGHIDPGHNGQFPDNHGHDNGPGGPGHHNGPGPQPGPWHPQPGYPDNNHHDQPYSPVYPDMNCVTWEFTAQTPNTRTDTVGGEEMSFDCYTDNTGTQYCRPTGNYFSRKVTVNIGTRQLESWEKESLKVCADSGSSARVDTDGMLYQYTVSSQDHNGFLGFGSYTEFTLTPGAKKPAQPDSKELSVASVVSAQDGVRLTLNDARAQYFQGEQITITADGMRIPEITPDMPVQDVLDSFTQFKVTGTFSVAGSYQLKLMDKPKPGKYMVTITFSRQGPLSSGASADVIETFEIK